MFPFPIEGQHKRDVGTLLKAALGLLKPEGQSSSTSETNDSQKEDSTYDSSQCEDTETNDGQGGDDLHSEDA